MTAVCTCDLEGVEDLGPGLPVSAYPALRAQCRRHGARCLIEGCERPAATLEYEGRAYPRMLCDPCREKALGAEKKASA